MAEGKKKWWIWLLVGCGALLVVCGGGAIGFASCIYGATAPPADAAHAFFADLRAGNDAGAFQRMNDGYRSTHTVETFGQAVSAIPAMRTQTDSTFSNRNISNNMATVSGHLTTPGGDVPLTVELTGFGNSWSIVSVTAGGTALQ